MTRVDGAGELMSMMLGIGQRLVVGGLGTNMCWVFSFIFILGKSNKIA